jgi:hypothetical protein
MSDRRLHNTLAPQLMSTWLSDVSEATRLEITDLWLDHIQIEDLRALRIRLEAFLTYTAARCVSEVHSGSSSSSDVSSSSTDRGGSY